MKNLIIALIQSMAVMTTFASWNGTDYWALIRNKPTGTEERNGISWHYYVYSNYNYVAVWPNGSLPNNVVIPSEIGGYPVGEFYGVNGEDAWSVSIPGSVRRVERANFNGGFSTLTNLVVRDGASIWTVIDEQTFEGCSNLKSVSLGEGVIEVRRWSFRFCGSLEKVVLPRSLQSIGAAAFADSYDMYMNPDQMPFLEADGGNYYLGDWLITGWDASMIRAGTRGIADDAINGGWTPELPEGIEYIGERSCGNSLPSRIPQSVKFIGSYAFGEPRIWYSSWENPWPTEVNGICYYDGWCFGPMDWDNFFVDEMEYYRQIEDRAQKGEEEYWQMIQDDAYLQMKRDAEDRMNQKRNVRIIDGTVGIASSAFNASGCGGNNMMTNIVFPASVKYIGNSAFEFSPALQGVSSLTNVETIGKFAFSQCEALPSVMLSKTIDTLSYGAFYECWALTNVYCGAENYDTLCLYSATASRAKVINLHLYRPIKYVGDSAFGKINLIYEEGVTDIGKVIGGEGAGEIVIPSSVTNISDNAFDACPALSNVVIKIVNSADVKFTGKVFNGKYQIKVVALPYNAKGYDDLIAQLGADKVKFTVGTESGFGQWVLVNGLAGQGSAADFGGKSGGNKYENGFLYIFGNEIENESVALIQLDKAKDGQIAFRIPETEHEDKVKVVGTANLNDWSNAIELKKEGDVWVMPDGTKPPDSFFCRVIISE